MKNTEQYGSMSIERIGKQHEKNQILVLRLQVSILIDINEDWIKGNKYIAMEQ